MKSVVTNAEKGTKSEDVGDVGVARINRITKKARAESKKAADDTWKRLGWKT